ncbi:hypothetical protein GCM10025882_22410 [Acinetobacter gyllenbergii]|uniref:Beta-lactamase n=1 Tax=Acinetobacter gyllenbergii CIP 110306 = MTCC 11365 TaxID=1217657 RepID=A0A829HBW4_9GAMM|nr:tetratricopeptide repeat protein [Acinetobacter gyllenbergii]EPF71656.1 hypothetical protein F957_03842 [Acinetobacter gyllenbergii CIP 110306 = MTCC 11365]GMA11816.1 hypothetical protein GCM10025882_22410 [Acinetobacter gyllenbergii]
MKFLFSVFVLMLSLTGCDVKAGQAHDKKISIDLSKINEVMKRNDEKEKKQFFSGLVITAGKDDAIAQNLMGVIYENGYLDQKKDMNKAIYWYTQAVKNNNGFAENNLGSLYAHGIGVEQDYRKAYEYYKNAMEKNIPEAINSIGFMYFNGFYLKQDLKKACEYYQKAADLGHLLAQANVANCYYNGSGGTKSLNKYFEYSLKAAEQGYAPSQFNVAAMYKKGEVIDKSIEKSVYWYKKAIENSEPRAAYNLASLYEKGDGVKQDFDLAYAYYTLAKEFGLGAAQKKLLELDSKVLNGNIRVLRTDEDIKIAVDDSNHNGGIVGVNDFLNLNN